MCIVCAEEDESRLQLYLSLQDIYRRSHSVRRIPLKFTTGLAVTWSSCECHVTVGPLQVTRSQTWWTNTCERGSTKECTRCLWAYTICTLTPRRYVVDVRFYAVFCWHKSILDRIDWLKLCSVGTGRRWFGCWVPPVPQDMRSLPPKRYIQYSGTSKQGKLWGQSFCSL